VEGFSISSLRTDGLAKHRGSELRYFIWAQSEMGCIGASSYSGSDMGEPLASIRDYLHSSRSSGSFVEFS
jgi:hypothetical protein